LRLKPELRDNPDLFASTWHNLMEALWKWQPLTDEEWKRYFPGQKKPLSQEALLITDSGQSISSASLFDACKAQVEKYLKAEQAKYDPELYVSRLVMEARLAEFLKKRVDDDGPQCFVIVAPAGSGKTNLLCHLAYSQITQAGRPALLLLGRNLRLDSAAWLGGAMFLIK
jgi:flagellar biosynthesis GTPase FlhF